MPILDYKRRGFVLPSFRGDAWKFYLKLKKTTQSGKEINHLQEISELEEIYQFYNHLDSHLLRKIRYRMLKEKKGSGMIPIFVTAIPWLLFIFSKQLQGFLFKDGGYLWLIFGLVYLTILISSVIIHFRENAWANVHTEIIEDILSIRGDYKTKSNSY